MFFFNTDAPALLHTYLKSAINYSLLRFRDADLTFNIRENTSEIVLDVVVHTRK